LNGARSPARDGRRTFDLVVRGGEVVDPATGRAGRYDVAVLDGRIASVAREIPAHLAREVVEAQGCLVLPGLVDLHTHVFAGGTYWGIDPAPIAWRTGVTTWVDAGSAGAFNLEAFRRLCVDQVATRTYAFLNISTIGLVAETGEARREELCDPALCAAAVEAHRDVVVGVKCRLDHFVVGTTGLASLRGALAAAAAAEVPVMVHIGAGPPGIDEVLDLLRPGDLVTHCATGHSMALVDAAGRVRRGAARARERGVLLDVGHGSGGFSFKVAEALLAAGVLPDVISSDLHQRSLPGPVFDLPTCLSKFLALGMSVEEVVRAATVGPARAIGLDGAVGSLEEGRRADISVFELASGDYVLHDSYGEPRRAERLLVNRATILAGHELGPVPDATPAMWMQPTAEQRAFMSRDAEDLRRPRAAPRAGGPRPAGPAGAP
jgi:dihydroorotase